MAKKKKKSKDDYQKQRASVYTMMLIASFLALVLGCVLLYKEMEKYGFDHRAKEYKAGSAQQMQIVATDQGAIT